jgi:hypothetical protein
MLLEASGADLRAAHATALTTSTNKITIRMAAVRARSMPFAGQNARGVARAWRDRSSRVPGHMR